jgi:hypothetical protein
METYRVGVAENPTDIEFNSCSTMHTIHKKEFVLDDFSHEHLIFAARSLLGNVIGDLNDYREMFVEWDKQPDSIKAAFGNDRKNVWWQIIQLLPSSYNQTRTVQLNYQVLKNIYHSRKDHKLDEWRELCRWIENLPYSEVIV